MIRVTVFRNTDNLITGLKMSGHADYAEKGSDIMCAAVSALVINTINSIEHFTTDIFDLSQDEDKGFMEFHMVSPVSNYGNLLLNSLVFGLKGIEKEYKRKYIRVSYKKNDEHTGLH